MKKLQLLVALAIINFTSIQTMDHSQMEQKRDQLQEAIITAFNELAESSEKSKTILYTEEEPYFNISKSLFDIQRKQNPNSMLHDKRINPAMSMILTNVEDDSVTGSRTATITLIDKSKN